MESDADRTQTFPDLDLKALAQSREDKLLPKSQAVLSCQDKTANKKRTWFFGGFCFIVCLCFKELVQNPSAWFPMQPPSLVGPSYMTCSGAVAEKQKLFPSPGCPALLLGATLSLVSFLMSLALVVPGEQGPRNAVCVTAAAAAEACPGQPPPTPVARESPGAMGEAGWK